MDRSRPGLLTAALVIVSLAAACGGSDDEDSASTTTAEVTTTTEGSTTTEAETTTTAADTATTEAETTTTAAAGQAQVDLDFTGTYVFQVHGQFGECSGADGAFAFSMDVDDVGAVGEGFSVEGLGEAEAAIDWVIDPDNSYSSSATGLNVISADGTSATINDELEQLQRLETPRPVHVAGTIACL